MFNISWHLMSYPYPSKECHRNRFSIVFWNSYFGKYFDCKFFQNFPASKPLPPLFQPPAKIKWELHFDGVPKWYTAEAILLLGIEITLILNDTEANIISVFSKQNLHEISFLKRTWGSPTIEDASKNFKSSSFIHHSFVVSLSFFRRFFSTSFLLCSMNFSL